MDAATAATLISVIVWTAVVAGAAWYAKSEADKADIRLLEADCAAKDLEIANLLEQSELAAAGEQAAIDYLRRRAEAAAADDPSDGRRMLYADASGDDEADPSGDQAG